MPARTPMVLIHGWAGSAESWGPVAARLSESTDFEPVCVRLPGSPGGGSGDEASIAAAAARVVTHLRARGQASVLVGHSMGGQISLLVHAAVPELVVGEVVIDPAYGADPSGAEAMEEWARQIERRGHDALGPFFEGALGSLDERTRAAIMGDLGNTSVATIVSYLRSEYLDQGAIGYFPETCRAAELRRRPMLAIHSTAVGAAREAMLPAPPTRRIDVWRGHGHFLHLEDPSRFLNTIRDWLSDGLPPGSPPTR